MVMRSRSFQGIVSSESGNVDANIDLKVAQRELLRKVDAALGPLCEALFFSSSSNLNIIDFSRVVELLVKATDFTREEVASIFRVSGIRQETRTQLSPLMKEFLEKYPEDIDDEDKKELLEMTQKVDEGKRAPRKNYRKIERLLQKAITGLKDAGVTITDPAAFQASLEKAVKRAPYEGAPGGNE